MPAAHRFAVVAASIAILGACSQAGDAGEPTTTLAAGDEAVIAASSVSHFQRAVLRVGNFLIIFLSPSRTVGTSSSAEITLRRRSKDANDSYLT